MSATQEFEAIRAFGEHEHREILWELGRIHEAAGEVGLGSHIEARRAVREVIAWLARTLEPHMAWEDTWLYPQLELITGTSWSTRMARFDHVQIGSLIARLREDEAVTAHSITPASTRELGADLLALEALLRAHIDREEQLLLPVLEGSGLGA
jgi:iron-sulfur cluster repair protein YtfE (RIC family)